MHSLIALIRRKINPELEKLMPPSRVLAQDSVFKLVQNGDLAKTLNTVRTVPGAKNPFVSSRSGGSSNGSSNTSNSGGNQTSQK
jgi:hypothetical protein